MAKKKRTKEVVVEHHWAAWLMVPALICLCYGLSFVGDTVPPVLKNNEKVPVGRILAAHEAPMYRVSGAK